MSQTDATMGGMSDRALIYTRNPSKGRPVRDWLGDANQLEACRAYCQEHGLEVCRAYEEHASAEVPLRIRPCGINLAAALEGAEHDPDWSLTLVVVVGDRLWSSPAEALVLLAWLAGMKITLAIVEEEVEIGDDPDGDHEAQAGGSWYCHALAQLVEGTERLALEAAREAQDRDYQGPAPFGLRAVKGRLQPNPKELAVLGRIYTLSKVGRCSDAEIVRVLAREGAVARRGGPVKRKAVRQGLERMERDPNLRTQALAALERARAATLLTT